MKTPTGKIADIKREWHLFDAQGQVLGRLATQIATILMGKHKPSFERHQDVGDHVVVINAEKVVLTGNKLDAKKYYHHSQYPGGLKERTARQVLDKHPERLIKEAVRTMMPDNKLRSPRMRRLKIYAGGEHPHQAQMSKPAGA